MQRLHFARPELKDKILVLHASEGRDRLKVVGVCRHASAAGIVPGMPVAEASSLVGKHSTRLQLEKEDPQADRLLLARVAQRCQRYSPTVSLEESDRPECLFLDITGCAHLFGGEEGLAQRLTVELARGNWNFCVAIADTIGAAWAVARHGQRSVHSWQIVPAGQSLAALRGLRLAALRLPPEVAEILTDLGVRRIGDLEQLPRASLVSRLGPAVAQRLSQAEGQALEILVPHRPIPCYRAEVSLEQPLEHSGIVENLSQQLLEEVLKQLPAGAGITELLCRYLQDSALPLEFRVGLFRPSVRKRHLWELIRLQLENLRFDRPMVGASLRVTGTAPLECAQQELFEERTPSSERNFSILLDRLSSRLGREAVVRVRSVSDAQPEFAFQEEPWLGTQRRPVPKVSPKRKRTPESAMEEGLSCFRRPLRLWKNPTPVRVLALAPEGPPRELSWGKQRERIVYAWGPERIETGWWRGPAIARDYYQAETDRGRRLWLFRERGSSSWYLQGVF